MDDKKEGLLLIGSSMIILIAFLVTFFAVMVIYRRRRDQHNHEIKMIGEKYSGELLKAQLEVQQRTMQYIGQEIHDNVGQKLTLAVLYVQQLEMAGEEATKRIQAVASLIHESLGDLRSLTRSLTSANYIHKDLVELIRSECQKVSATGFCEVGFYSNAQQIGASEAVKSFVLRIVQEFFHNSIKHAKCSTMAVRMEMEEPGVRILAWDNGGGFDVQRLEAESTGIGISNMRKRANMIGADLVLTSVPGEGTSMNLFIPSIKLNH